MIDFREWVGSPVDESTQPEDRYYFGTLPFDVSKTCFNREVNELRGYLENASNRGESGKFDFERLFNTLFL